MGCSISMCGAKTETDPFTSTRDSIYHVRLEEYKKVTINSKKKCEINTIALDLAMKDIINTFKTTNPCN